MTADEQGRRDELDGLGGHDPQPAPAGSARATSRRARALEQVRRVLARPGAAVAAPVAVIGFLVAGLLLAATLRPSSWLPVVEGERVASVTDVDRAASSRVGGAGASSSDGFPTARGWSVPDASAASTSTSPTTTVPPRIPGELGIPAIVLEAYRSAEAATAADDPGCGLGWAVLAGIGKVESGHADGGLVHADGTTYERILGPVLDGSGGTARIPDSDDGRLDDDPVWDRAVGPMQFLPGTWRWSGVDGNDDGVADPHNVVDAALAAAGYLCLGSSDLRDRAALEQALLRYNRSDEYVALVLAWADAYASGQVTPLPPVPTPTTTTATTQTTPQTTSPTTPPTTEPTSTTSTSPTLSIGPTTATATTTTSTTSATTSAASTTSATSSPGPAER